MAATPNPFGIPTPEDEEKIKKLNKEGAGIKGKDVEVREATPAGTLAVPTQKEVKTQMPSPYVPQPFLPPGTEEAIDRVQGEDRPRHARAEFADISGMPEQILRLRQQALQGLSQPELNALRAQSIQNIEGTRRTAARELERQQARQGVRGGVAFAQGEALRREALGARGRAERDILLADLARRRQALSELERTVGKERFGDIAQRLAERQLDIGEAAGTEQRALQQAFLERILNQPSATLPAGGGGGGFMNQLFSNPLDAILNLPVVNQIPGVR